MSTTTTDQPRTALDDVADLARPVIFRMLARGDIRGAWHVLLSFADDAGRAWRLDHDAAHPDVPQTLGHGLPLAGVILP
jgi:hypothetical protein